MYSLAWPLVNMENKQTAVQWLMMQLPVFIRVDLYEKELYEQAKEMETKQIKNAYRAGQANILNLEDFYKETYG